MRFAPYRTQGRVLVSPPRPREASRAVKLVLWVRFYWLPALFTKCPICETRACPHANPLSYFATFCMGGSVVLGVYYLICKVL